MQGHERRCAPAPVQHMTAGFDDVANATNARVAANTELQADIEQGGNNKAANHRDEQGAQRVKLCHSAGDAFILSAKADKLDADNRGAQTCHDKPDQKAAEQRQQPDFTLRDQAAPTIARHHRFGLRGAFFDLFCQWTVR